jgi:hypothetical protein
MPAHKMLQAIVKTAALPRAEPKPGPQACRKLPGGQGQPRAAAEAEITAATRHILTDLPDAGRPEAFRLVPGVAAWHKQHRCILTPQQPRRYFLPASQAKRNAHGPERAGRDDAPNMGIIPEDMQKRGVLAPHGHTLRCAPNFVQ